MTPGRLEEGLGPHPNLGVVPPIVQPLPFQICPSLEHASLVLLNSLLDTVPGGCCSGGGGRTPLAAGRAEPGLGQLGSPQASAPQLRFPNSEELCG